MMQLGPGMYSQQRGPCDECSGKGEIIDKSKQCKDCEGKKVKKESKKLKVNIDKGSPNGCKQVIHGEGHHVPDGDVGDVVVVVRQIEDKNFKRKGADLIMDKEITLLQALTGVSFVFTHFDGKKYRIETTEAEIIKPN